MNRKKQPSTNNKPSISSSSSSSSSSLDKFVNRTQENQDVPPASTSRLSGSPLHMRSEDERRSIINPEEIIRKPPPTACLSGSIPVPAPVPVSKLSRTKTDMKSKGFKMCTRVERVINNDGMDNKDDKDNKDDVVNSLLTNSSLCNLQIREEIMKSPSSSSSSSLPQCANATTIRSRNSSTNTTTTTNTTTKMNQTHRVQPLSSDYPSSSSSDECHKNKKQVSQVDAGYAGSASSNDGDGNNSSTSDSSCTNDGTKKKNVQGSRGDHHDDDSGQRGDRGRRNHQASNGSPSSSDIADFSSSSESDSSYDDEEELQEQEKYEAQHSDLSSSVKNDASERINLKVAAARTTTTATTATTFHSTTRSKASKRSRDVSSTSIASSSKARCISGYGSSSSSSSSSATSRVNLPSSWDFIARNIRKKSSTFINVQQNTQLIEQTTKALNENYQLAIDGFNGNISDISSTKIIPESQSSTVGIAYKSEYTPLYEIGVDVMAKILSYLSPPETIKVLSEPLSKSFRESFTVPQDVWKILCFSKPFYAHNYEEVDVTKSSGQSDNDFASSITTDEDDLKVLCSKYKYRLMYASFARCVTYLDRIKHDLKQGKASKLNNGAQKNQYTGNSSLRRFFEKARGIQSPQQPDSVANSSNTSTNETKSGDSEVNYQQIKKQPKSNNKLKYGASNITNKLLGPVHESGIAGDVDLPISCAVYSIVNWMVAFADVAGIQVVCMNVLPMLLEDDHQRTTAQNAGVTDIVLRAMVIFPNNAELHTSAFHTLVLLARPIGGKEGMIFYRAMVNASGIFNVGSSTGKSGIAIMMDSMRRFASNEKLQAMSCWSMVNVALIQSQKAALVKLGGITAAGNAMMLHPMSEEVQFRALFALINLVIPSENLPEDTLKNDAAQKQEGEPTNQRNEIVMLDDCIEFITDLVVVSMKNFCSNEAILNRACLVLHNLSLNTKYHSTLLYTNHCYQMLEWCVENYKQDRVLQQSARGTLQRLQGTLSNNESLRSKFLEMIRLQQRENQT